MIRFSFGGSFFLVLVLVLSKTCLSWLSQRRLHFGPTTASNRVADFRVLRATSDRFIPSLLASTYSASSSNSTRSEAFGERKASLQETLINAAAASTQATCRLIGVKAIGVDYGLVRTGIAATIGFEPKPIAILSDLNNTQVCREVISFARAEQASQIIVGLPLHKNGTVAEQTNITLVFAQELGQCVLAALGPNVPVYLWDERYSSKEAAARARAANPDRFLYATLDAEAACIILEHYFYENGEGSITVEMDASTRQDCLERYNANQMEEARRMEQNLLERQAKIQDRLDRIAQMKREDAELSSGQNQNTSSKKKKKKKKR
jgi:putative Holliday junction resolvase